MGAKRHPSSHWWWLALLVAVGVALVAAPPAAAQPASGSASGIVTVATGDPLEGVTVEARHWFFGGLVATATTSADGSYAFAALPAGDYRFSFSHPVAGTTWSGGSPTWAGSAVVTVPDGGTIVVDAQFPIADAIVGSVTDDGANPVGGVTVELLDQTGWGVRSTTTAADGTYDFSGVPAGNYGLFFNDPTGSHARLYGGGSPTFAGSERIVAAPDGSTHVMDAVLPDAGTLTGSATIGTKSRPSTELSAAGMAVIAFDGATSEIVGITVVAGDGTWSLGSLPPADYVIGLVDPAYFGADRTSGYRPVIMPDLDVEAIGLFPSLAAGTRFALSDGAALDVGAQHLEGWDCADPLLAPGAPASGASLGGSDLRGCDLSGTDLHGADLSGADLRGADIQTATLTGADLRGADLSDTDLIDISGGGHICWLGCGMFPPTTTWANLSGVQLAGADLSGAQVNPRSLCQASPDWSGIDFTGAVEPQFAWDDVALWNDAYTGQTRPLFAEGMTFHGNWPPASYPLRTFLYDCGGEHLFTGVQWPDGLGAIYPPLHRQPLETDWSGTDLSGMRCHDCHYVPGTTFAGSSLAAADLHGSSLAQVAFDGADLTGAIITRASLSGSSGLTPAQVIATAPDWTGVALDGTGLAFTGGDLGGRILRQARLSGLSLAGADLGGLDLTGAELASTNLSGANLADTQLGAARLDGALGTTPAQLASSAPDWAGTNLTGLSLAGADLTGRTASGAKLSGTDLTGATITGVDLTGAVGLQGPELLTTVHDWTGTRLGDTGVSLSGTDFAGGGFSVTGASFARLNLRNTIWTGVDVTDTDFTGADLSGAVGLFVPGADFTGADLRGMDFTGMDLSGVILRDALLSNAIFVSTRLTGADLSGAAVDGTSFRKAIGLTTAQLVSTDHNWRGISLDGTGMSLTNIDFVSDGYDLRDANLTGANLSGANLSGIDLDGANLTSVRFTNAAVTGTSFEGSTGLSWARIRLSNRDWRDTNFGGVSLTVAEDFSVGGWQLTGTSLRGVDLSGSTFDGVDLSGADLSEATLTGAPFDGADLTAADLSEATLAGARFDGADLTAADLSEATFAGASFDGTTITGASFFASTGLTVAELLTAAPDWTSTNLGHSSLPDGFRADFAGHDLVLIGTSFQWLDLTEANLSGLDLTGADLYHSVLTRADLTNTNLDGARVSEASLSNAIGLTTPQILETDPSWYRIKLDGTGLAFTGDDLRSRWLGSSTLNGLDLSGSDLSGSVLNRVSLIGADLTGVSLTGADIQHANLSYAVGVTPAMLESTRPEWDFLSLGGLDLSGITIDSTRTMERTSFVLTDLTGANLTGADFWLSSLAGADLTGATITGTSFWRAEHLTRAQVTATSPDWRGTVFSTTGIDFTGFDFTGHQVAGIVLSGLNLSAANFSGTDLSNAAIDSSQLIGTNFSGADLRNATIQSSNASAADFLGADLYSLNVKNASLMNARLTGANLTLLDNLTASQLGSTSPDWSGASVELGTVLKSFNFAGHGTNLAGVQFRSTDLTSANLTGRDLTGANFCAGCSTSYVPKLTGATVTGANFTGATGLTKAMLTSTNHNWSGTTLTGTGIDFTATDFVAGGYTLTGANLAGLTLTDTKLAGMNLTGATLTSTNLTRAALGGAILTDADLSTANLAQTAATGATFTGATMTGTRLTNANLTDAVGLTSAMLTATNHNWTNVKLAGTGVSLAGVDFAGYRLNGANLTGLNLTGANLTAVWNHDLTGTSFAGADLSGATLLAAIGNPSGGSSATYLATVCPDGTTASPATAQSTCVGHGMGA